MSVTKLSVSVDELVAKEAAVAAEEAGQSLSAWFSDAARQSLKLRAMRQLLAEWDEELGPLTYEERAAADAEWTR